MAERPARSFTPPGGKGPGDKGPGDKGPGGKASAEKAVGEKALAEKAPAEKTSGAAFSPRSLARRLTVQALYQWLLNETPPPQILRQFREQEGGLGQAHPEYFAELLEGTVQHAGALTAAVAPFLDRPVVQLDPVEHAILLLGAYGLAHEPAVPARVVVNEAVALAKTFGAEDGFKYINAVLDKLARETRPHEMR